MDTTKLKQLVLKIVADCTPEERKLIIEALDDFMQFEGDINDLKSAIGYLHAKIKRNKKD